MGSIASIVLSEAGGEHLCLKFFGSSLNLRSHCSSFFMVWVYLLACRSQLLPGICMIELCLLFDCQASDVDAKSVFQSFVDKRIKY